MVKMSLESGEALKELALTIKAMVKPFPADIHIQNSKSAAKSLNSLLKSSVGLWDDNMDLSRVVPVATVASLLIDVVNCTQEIADAIHELASIVNFEAIQLTSRPKNPRSDNPKL
ncbi:hypothetical protein Goari_021579 [Gossypium aridum]|uniref:Aluminum-activated malate transporter n=1 Tax=Gossypium aridum TaxID=34290 RepID=A0A7J8YFL0_GOSAI|nr:hypothetical protein [Gossypium aridum]